MATNADGTISTLSIEPPSGENKCAVSADQRSDEFGKIINEIKNLLLQMARLVFTVAKCMRTGVCQNWTGRIM